MAWQRRRRRCREAWTVFDEKRRDRRPPLALVIVARPLVLLLPSDGYCPSGGQSCSCCRAYHHPLRRACRPRMSRKPESKMVWPMAARRLRPSFPSVAAARLERSVRVALAVALAEQGSAHVKIAAPYDARARSGAAGEVGQSPRRVMRGYVHRVARRMADCRDEFAVGVAVDRLAQDLLPDGTVCRIGSHFLASRMSEPAPAI